VKRALLVALVLVAASASADDEPVIAQRMRFIERATALTVNTTITKLFDSAAYNALDSGFTSTVFIRMWVYPSGSTEPVSFVALDRQVVYNLWDEEYELSFKEPGGRRKFKEKRKSEALKALTSLDGVPIAPLANLPYGSPTENVYMLAMSVELNPVSDQTLTEVRRWLTQGSGGGLDRGGAFFGSFVSVFVNPKIPPADRVIRIRSQPFYRPRP
jgi:hypothetical protein